MTTATPASISPEDLQLLDAVCSYNAQSFGRDRLRQQLDNFLKKREIVGRVVSAVPDRLCESDLGDIMVSSDIISDQNFVVGSSWLLRIIPSHQFATVWRAVEATPNDAGWIPVNDKKQRRDKQYRKNCARTNQRKIPKQ